MLCHSIPPPISSLHHFQVRPCHSWRFSEQHFTSFISLDLVFIFIWWSPLLLGASPLLRYPSRCHGWLPASGHTPPWLRPAACNGAGLHSLKGVERGKGRKQLLSVCICFHSCCFAYIIMLWGFFFLGYNSKKKWKAKAEYGREKIYNSKLHPQSFRGDKRFVEAFLFLLLWRDKVPVWVSAELERKWNPFFPPLTLPPTRQSSKSFPPTIRDAGTQPGRVWQGTARVSAHQWPIIPKNPTQILDDYSLLQPFIWKPQNASRHRDIGDVCTHGPQT